MVATFRGFSTVDKAKPSFSLRDIELVKRDLLNHFHTRKGERVMMPDFGSNIQNYVMEPMVSDMINIIKDDVTTVINSEPRADLIGIEVYNEEHTVQIEIELVFKPGDIADNLYLEFTKE
ncbi:MAG: hypothetical protein DRH08_03990 [Deltaproteobacteria bacterium]|nr:MAG: hypothetical protein DRH08_03990 [Deltaproteobacteria bacterium]